MAEIDLSALVYPRHLHKGDGESLSVDSPEACESALSDGWHLEPWNHWTRCLASPAPEGVERPWLDEPEPADTVINVVEVPVKRKPGRPKKTGA